MKREVWEWVGEWEWGWGWLWMALLLCAMISVWRAMELLVWRPRRVEEQFSGQGIKGPPYQFFVGNVLELFRIILRASSTPMEHPFSHSILSHVLPFLTEWSKIYGSTFLMWCGPTPRVTVTEPDLIRAIMLTKADAFDRIESHPFVRQLEGGGLLNLQGETWARRRKILSPFFHRDNLAPLISVIGKRMEETTAKWAVSPDGGEVEVEVSEYFDELASEVISRAICGDSYSHGKEVTSLQTQQINLIGKSYSNFLIPGYSFLPTKGNIAYWKVSKKVQSTVARIIGLRGEKEEKQGRDLIDFLMASTSPALSPEDIMAECKTFFFAGKKTISCLLSWTTVMLAAYPKWQDLAREEILHVCGSSSIPTTEQIGKLKTLSMILNETLRLYPPIVAIVRTANTHVEIGGRLKIPRGTQVFIPILAIHHDQKLWGEDASEFDPSRFATRVAQPAAFMPFGHGGRVCIGQSLAVLEAKLFMALLLRKFSLRLSPSYIHAPSVTLMLGHQHGAPIVFKLLSQDAGEDT